MAFSEKHYRTNEPSEWTCLSTDTKDTPSTNGKIKVTDIAYETDTGDKYEYRGSTAGWVISTNAGSISIYGLARDSAILTGAGTYNATDILGFVPIAVTAGTDWTLITKEGSTVAFTPTAAWIGQQFSMHLTSIQIPATDEVLVYI